MRAKGFYIFLFIILIINNTYSQSSLEAKFLASEYEIMAGSCVDFTDMSTGNPTYWKWTFDGAQPSESEDRNPRNICYFAPGKYDVTLEVQNTFYTDTEIVKGCIIVSDNGGAPLANFSADFTLIPVGEPVQFKDLSLNGPFVSYEWTFTGGTPEKSVVANPVPIVYSEPGTYNVKLVVTNEADVISILELRNYIKVISKSSENPVADFIADRTYIAPGENINLKDLSKGNPHIFSWTFDGGSPTSSTKQNPTAIQYAMPGTYDIQLIVENSLGKDTIIKENYITVAKTDPCVAAPIVDFTATQRLIQAGATINFQDKTLNNPTEWVWTFDGGSPINSGVANPLRGITYLNEGHFAVTLSVRNACGDHFLTKDKYIRVFLDPVSRYCNDINNVEGITSVTNPQPSELTWGSIGGHNSQRVRAYAEKFNVYSFSEIEYLKVPVTASTPLSGSSYITFYIWDGNTRYPENIIAEKRVSMNDLPRNYIANIKFDPPVEIEGPFFVGYRLNYAGGSGSTANDNDNFTVGLVNWGRSEVNKNTLYVQETNNTWKSIYEKYNINASSALQIGGCIVDIETTDLENNIEVFPNPANEIIKIKTGELINEKNAIVQIIDITGKILIAENINLNNEVIELNIQKYPEGLYFVNLIVGKSKLTRKVVISR